MAPVKQVRAIEKAAADVRTAALVGYISGEAVHLYPDGPFDEVPAPPGCNDATVAFEIREDSPVSFFDNWLIFLDNERRPITSDLFNRMCVVGLRDGRVMIRAITQSRTEGRYHLVSQVAPPQFDVEIEWGAAVTGMAPK